MLHTKIFHTSPQQKRRLVDLLIIVIFYVQSLKTPQSQDQMIARFGNSCLRDWQNVRSILPHKYIHKQKQNVMQELLRKTFVRPHMWQNSLKVPALNSVKFKFLYHSPSTGCLSIAGYSSPFPPSHFVTQVSSKLVVPIYTPGMKRGNGIFLSLSRTQHNQFGQVQTCTSRSRVQRTLGKRASHYTPSTTDTESNKL